MGILLLLCTRKTPSTTIEIKIYQQLGFGDFLSIGDFEGAPYYHAGVCDYATYDKILDLLRTDEAPQFIFDVTMQNHAATTMAPFPPKS